VHIYGNEVWDSASHGITVTSEGRGHVDGVYVYNNLVHGMDNNGFLVYDHPGGRAAGSTVRDVAFVNNTAVRCGSKYGGGFRIDHSSASGILIRNNIAWNNTSYDVRGASKTVIEANLAREDLNLGDPRFADPSTGDYHLLPISPAIDRGLFTGSVFFDKEGTPRPMGVGSDLGCYEYKP
jgi:hypothetical protein